MPQYGAAQNSISARPPTTVPQLAQNNLRGAPPIVLARAPAPSQAQQQQVHYAAAPHNYGAVSAPTPQRTAPAPAPGPAPIVSAHGNVGASGLAASVGGLGAQTSSGISQLVSRFLSARDPYNSPAAHGVTGGSGAQAFAMKQAKSDWASLAAKGVLPPGAKFPTIRFDSSNPGAAYVTTRDRVIHLPPGIGRLLQNPKDPNYAWAREALVHEMAHTMQNPIAHSSVPMVEGGAQAWANQVGNQAMPNFKRAGDGNYASYVTAMNVQEPHSWVRQGQFNPAATNAPTIMAPGTKDFAGAMSGLGRYANSQVQRLGRNAASPTTNNPAFAAASTGISPAQLAKMRAFENTPLAVTNNLIGRTYGDAWRLAQTMPGGRHKFDLLHNLGTAAA